MIKNSCHARVWLFLGKNCATIANFSQKLTALPKVQKKTASDFPPDLKAERPKIRYFSLFGLLDFWTEG